MVVVLHYTGCSPPKLTTHMGGIWPYIMIIIMVLSQTRAKKPCIDILGAFLCHAFLTSIALNMVCCHRTESNLLKILIRHGDYSKLCYRDPAIIQPDENASSVLETSGLNYGRILWTVSSMSVLSNVMTIMTSSFCLTPEQEHFGTGTVWVQIISLHRAYFGLTPS